MTNQKTKRLTIYLTDIELQNVKKRAELKHLPVSCFIRSQVLSDNKRGYETE